MAAQDMRSTTHSSLRFLALGDSYTIGESVAESERWPVQLVKALRARGIPLDPPEIIAQTGWTTGELANEIDATPVRPPYQLVSLMIGVNNQYRGYSLDEYREEFVELLRRAIVSVGDDPTRVLVLSIPDWGVTPYAAQFNPGNIAQMIDAFNEVNRQEAERLGARYVDVTPISRRAASQPDLIAGDGLHPSGKMYSDWVEMILPIAQDALVE